MKRTKIVAFLTLLVIICILMLGGCEAAWREFGNYDDPAKYTTSQHIERISKIVRENYIGDGEFTDFAVYPLYDKDDNVIFYLVEFEPHGFLYIRAKKPNWAMKTEMYMKDITEVYSTREFWRYRISDIQPQEFEGKTWQNKFETTGANEGYIREPQKWYESDENGIITYSSSPYKVADVKNEKRYALLIKDINDINGPSAHYYVPAVKRGEKYLNLVSMEEFAYSSELSDKSIPCSYISQICKNAFNLSNRGAH